jgi:ADP-ribose pyrophosphatase YjhB (NUDIX family)
VRSLRTTVAREAKEETGVDVIVTDLVSVKSDRRMITYANGDQAQYMDHLFLCEVAPGGNGETGPSAMTKACASGGSRSTICPNRSATAHAKRIAYVQRFSGTVRRKSARAQFAFDGVIEHL